MEQYWYLGPVCVDPGFPDDGQVQLTSVEEGAQAKFSCNRAGFKPFPSDTINCTLGTACVLAEDVGISSGFIPDGAFADNSDSTTWGYEPHKVKRFLGNSLGLMFFIRITVLSLCSYKELFMLKLFQ